MSKLSNFGEAESNLQCLLSKEESHGKTEKASTLNEVDHNSSIEVQALANNVNSETKDAEVKPKKSRLRRYARSKCCWCLFLTFIILFVLLLVWVGSKAKGKRALGTSPSQTALIILRPPIDRTGCNLG